MSILLESRRVRGDVLFFDLQSLYLLYIFCLNVSTFLATLLLGQQRGTIKSKTTGTPIISSTKITTIAAAAAGPELDPCWLVLIVGVVILVGVVGLFVMFC